MEGSCLDCQCSSRVMHMQEAAAAPYDKGGSAEKDYNMIQSAAAAAGLDLPNCTAVVADHNRIRTFYADSICHTDLNRPECNFDGGDCACQDQATCGDYNFHSNLQLASKQKKTIMSYLAQCRRQPAAGRTHCLEAKAPHALI